MNSIDTQHPIDSNTVDLIKDDPRAYLKSSGVDLADNAEIVLKQNTKRQIFIVIPSNHLSQGELTNLTAAGRSGSVSTALSAASVGTICSTASSASSATTAGTVSSS